MSDSYTKLFSSIVASTIVDEPVATRWLWVTFLSQAGKDGCVYGSVPGMARLANITRAECEAGLARFLSPDPDSRSQEQEGRRVEEIDGGWRLINHAKYAAIRSAEERREYKRNWDRENRQSRNKSDESDNNPTNPTNSDESDRLDPTSSSSSTNTSTTKKEQKQKKSDASPKAQPARGCRLPDDWKPDDELTAWARGQRPDLNVAQQVESFRDYWKATPGAKGRKVDWPATFRNWIRNAHAVNGRGKQENGKQPTSVIARAVAHAEESARQRASGTSVGEAGGNLRLPLE